MTNALLLVPSVLAGLSAILFAATFLEGLVAPPDSHGQVIDALYRG